MPFFERYLSVWVALAIVAGVTLGVAMPGAFEAVAGFEYAHVNLAVAVFIWVMVYPMMIQIDFTAIKKVGQNPRGLLLTLVINWLIKPFTMAALGWLFFKVFFAGWVDPQTATEYIAGMILLGVAPCTAMVFGWSQLAKGDANYTLVQVSVNDVIMVFAFAPIAALLLGVSRAIGETMIVVMAAGLAANLTVNPLEAVTTVTVQIVTLLTGDQEFDSAKTLAAFALGLMLFITTLLLNVVALHIVKKYREQYE